jgi:hypothetical protein
MREYAKAIDEHKRDAIRKNGISVETFDRIKLWKSPASGLGHRRIREEHYLMGSATVRRPRSSLSMAVAIARAARALGCRSQGRRHDESISTQT